MNETLASPQTQTYPLSSLDIDSYQQNGHILLREVASPEEVKSYRAAIDEAVAKYNTETRALAERDTYGKAFLQIMNLWEQDEAVRRFVLAKRFAQIAADLMGCANVRIYHDQALFKEPGGGFTPWHQDQYYWPLDTDKTITLWMPLVDITEDMGIIKFASGSHTEGYIDKLGISDASQNFLEEYIQKNNFPISTTSYMQAGDATFHSGWTLHGAPGNNSGTMREVMTIIYFADGAKAIEPDNKNRQADLERWLPGVKPGELAASPLNPLVL
ncbi:phytanoyl-CoA dioxygenase [Adhaeribacter arboris]|uniref:Phytanoyl-CoA dioxygenase n=1 Tax=Adhaeribacter arboris TaxID=2072846 RepID=A0A2T2YMR1_9BACT|nr:phytanoyl-CoA dioxygenase family protein [Adhaeribacter arboris]PSR56797.1 phytanoyl-CoA dioxygenase [Adhaeribacter arboris]